MKKDQNNVKTIKTIRKIKIVSKNKSKPPSNISFDEWLIMGKKMGWDVQSLGMPMVLQSYDKDNDQIERHAEFLRSMTKLIKKIKLVSDSINEINNSFKTEDHQEIFDSKIEFLMGTAEYYRSGAIESKKKLYEEQAHSIYSRYRNNTTFRKRVDSLVEESEEVA